MKKNKMMRLAAVLMVAVLMTTCAISGTFAKYITQADVEDSARVAKWGVQVTATGSLFETSYIDMPETTGSLTVKSSNSDDLVAPGTKNENCFQFSITGKPEVAVNVSFGIEGVKDVVLPEGEYLDYTTGNDSEDKFSFTGDYYPVQYTLTHVTTDADGEKTTVTKKGTMDDIKKYLESLEGDYEPNTLLESVFGEFDLTWEWVFGDPANDKKDTYLGQVAAEIETNTNVKLEAAADINITVAQIN